jgi:putative transposase
LQQIRAYNVKHNYNVSSFLEDYRRLLQRAVDEIWNNIVWIKKKNFYRVKENKNYYVTRIIPIVTKSNEFKNHYLRNLLMKDWRYSKHYVDSAIKQAYSIVKSWSRFTLTGEEADEDFNELKRSPRLMNLKSYVSQKTT